MPPYSPKEAFTHVYNLKGYVYDIHIVYSTSYGNWLQKVQIDFILCTTCVLILMSAAASLPATGAGRDW